jgi:hypothetical protein
VSFCAVNKNGWPNWSKLETTNLFIYHLTHRYFNTKKHPKVVPITEVFKKAKKYVKMHEKGMFSNQAEPARNDTNLLTDLLFPFVISKFDY